MFIGTSLLLLILLIFVILVSYHVIYRKKAKMKIRLLEDEIKHLCSREVLR